MSGGDPAEIAKGISALFLPEQVVELRIFDGGRTCAFSGYFLDHEKMVRDACTQACNPRTEGLYFTLQKIDPQLLARAANRLVLHPQMTTPDKHALRYRWLPLDFDAMRPAKISANDEQKAAAMELAGQAAAWFAEKGFVGLLADSGNGAHLLYRVDFANEAAGAALMERAIKALALKFGTEKVGLDTTVYSPAQIWKCYGTTPRKGDPIPGRPHRMAKLLSNGAAELPVLPREWLEEIAPPERKRTAYGVPPPRHGDPAGDMEAFLKAHHVVVNSERIPLDDGAWKWLVTCPFNSEHGGGSDTAVFAGKDGSRGFECKHFSCERNRWPQFCAKIGAASPDVPVVEPQPEAFGDMPVDCLDGDLGELCREKLLPLSPAGYAWVCLLAAAGALVRPHPNCRTNLFGVLVGEVGTGKTETSKNAFAAVNLGPPTLKDNHYGSGEQMLRDLGEEKPDGEPRLLWIDELVHLFSKMQIEHASFASTLCEAWNKDGFRHSMAKAKVNFACRLSLLGGVVSSNFDSCFANETVGGFYDRCTLAYGPIGFKYRFAPFDAFPPRTHAWKSLTEIAPDVWEARTAWVNAGMPPRIAEMSLRAAYICASWEHRTTLRADHLEPAHHFARYQMNLREFLKPNPGKNPSAALGIAILRFMHKHAPTGEALRRIAILRGVHAYESPGVVVSNQVLAALTMGGEIELVRRGKETAYRLGDEQLSQFAAVRERHHA